MSSRAATLATLPFAALALTACLEHPIKKVLYDKSSVGNKDVAIAINKDVDILFVIDNSGSMADEQALLAKNFEAFINVLEADDVQANYRIGITTTDSGNPNCPASQTTPEAGKLVLSSCLDRIDLGDFQFNTEDASYACEDVCSLRDADLQIKPTATQYSNGEEAPRKWIERIGDQTNLPPNVTTVEAFQCFGPQGVSGCGFEQHLESMYKALAKASTKGDPDNYGFIRDTAILSVVFITDEMDCSHNPKYQEIFTSGNKTFWEDPNRPNASSAICVNAGILCEGDGPQYTGCRSANYGIDGSVGVPDEEAVMQPLSKYINQLASIEAEKRKFDMGQEVLVALIAGVPPGYEDGGELTYEIEPDTEENILFGIGKGCTLPNPADPDSPQTAVPPVRLREFAEAFQVGDERNVFSICQDDYSGALQAIANKIRDQLKPACMPECVRDTNPETPELEPNCQLFEENLAMGTRNPIEPCIEVDGDWVAPANKTVCFALRTDPGGETPSAIDNMSPDCVAEGYNLEFDVRRSAAAPAGTTISAACELSPNPANDCPML